MSDVKNSKAMCEFFVLFKYHKPCESLLDLKFLDFGFGRKSGIVMTAQTCCFYSETVIFESFHVCK